MTCTLFDHAMSLAVLLCCVAVAAIAAHMWLEVLDQIKKRKSVHRTSFSDPLSPADVVRHLAWRNEQMRKALNNQEDQHG